MLETLLKERPVETGIAVSAFTLVAAYLFQYGFGYHPCELCYYQRYPYFAIVSIGLAGMIAMKRMDNKSLVTPLLLIFLLLFLIDAAIAGFHVGVEQKWWEGPTACSSMDFSGSIEEQLQQIMEAPMVRCDEIAWSLFGISMAGYNFLIALSMTIFTALSLKKRKTV